MYLHILVDREEKKFISLWVILIIPTYVAAADGVSQDEALGDHEFGSGANGTLFIRPTVWTRF